MRSEGLEGFLSQQGVPTVFRVPPLGLLDIYEITVEALQRNMSEGNLTSVNYVTYCLERIRKVCLSSFAVRADSSVSRKLTIVFHRLGKSIS